ncbi:ATP-binding protein [Shouchella rhizosphaerae]|uniref:ATP-binding protein n=1 Tax=Shouchella rhizosphaerae TaxID=866786 RepID=UPI003F7DB44E
MSTKKQLLIICMFLFSLLTIRLIWNTMTSLPDQPTVENGVLDLSNFTFHQPGYVSLEGEWRFTSISGKGERTKTLPSQTKSGALGTYQLDLYVQDKENRYGLFIHLPHGIFSVSANGQHLYDSSTQSNRITPATLLFIQPDQNGRIRLTLQIEAIAPHTWNPNPRSLYFGPSENIEKKNAIEAALQIAVSAIMFFHGLYACILKAIKPQKKGILFFALASFFSALAVLISDNKVLGYFIILNSEWEKRLSYLFYAGLSPAFLLFFLRTFVPTYKRTAIATAIFFGVCLIYLLVVPLSILQKTASSIAIVIVAGFSTITIIMLKTILARVKGRWLLYLAASAVISNVLWMNLYRYADRVAMPTIKFYPVDLTVAFVCFSTFWFMRFFYTEDENTKLLGQLKQEHERKNQFLASTSHEMRNPLHGMINIAQTVATENKQVLDQKSQQSLELLVSIGRRMSYLLNDLIDLAVFKERKLTLQQEATQLEPIIRRTVDTLNFLIDNEKTRFVVAIPKDFPLVFADANRVSQILFNLLHNAGKFTNEGTITIAASHSGKLATIRVTDTGLGMDQSTRARIFEPYEQGANADNEGLGLGLAICKELVEMHGGQINVVSSPGRGSSFSFTLPLAKSTNHQAIATVLTTEQPNEVAATQAPQQPKREAPFRILAVDDDPVNLKVLRHALSTKPYQLVTETSPKATLRKVAEERWDLVIADVMMPEMSGLELVKHIRQTYSVSELPILLVTARIQPEDIYAGFRAGANDYIGKPVDLLELQTRIEAMLALKQSIEDRLRLEAAWLQAQIEPHFLFNTLNTIASLSTVDTDRMLDLIAEFGRYLRASFNEKNLSPVIPLSEELDLLRSYLYIEQERFGDRLQVKWAIDEHVDCLVPPLSIQPLAENAILHGILKQETGGTLEVHVYKKDGKAHIAIKDDGVGMDQDTLNTLFTQTKTTKKSIGLANTNLRLQKQLGNGLSVSSEIGKGTTVSFTAPLQ